MVSLKRPEDYNPEEGARFEVHFDKARGFMGTDAEPFEATLSAGGWVTRDLKEALEDQIIALADEGLKQRDIAKEVNRGLGTVNRILKKHREGNVS